MLIKHSIIAIFKEFLHKYPKYFILLFSLLVIEGIIAVSTILAIIPFTDFLDENKYVGDNIWNPSQIKGSGGLIQMQLLLFSDKKRGNFEAWVDSIKLVKLKK